METIASRAVNDIAEAERRTLESILGRRLSSDQEVLILAYTPGLLPTDDARDLSRQRIEATLAANQSFAQQHDVRASDADEAIDDALRQIRRRS